MGRKRPWADRHYEFEAELKAIGERSTRPVAGVSALPISNPAVRSFMESAGDVPRLLAALGVALNLHQPRNWWLFRPVCRGCDQFWPCDEYTGIRDAILTTTPAASEEGHPDD